MPSIAITDAGQDRPEFDCYAAWVRRWMPGTGIVRLAHASDNRAALAGCDGLVLSGGADVHPRHYGRLDALDAIGRVDEERDEFEFRVIEDARVGGMPVVGICRGTQIFSVALGGTLIPDIERTGRPSHRKDGTADRVHTVAVDPVSSLHAIVRCAGGDVNSSHHQAVDTPGKGLVVAARSEDGVAEAFEWASPAGRPFLMLVQWHPERMQDPESPFARDIMLRFAREAGRFAGRQQM